MDERLLAYTIAWIFLARGGNHATLMIGDLIAIQTMKDKVKFDQVACVVVNILKIKRLSDLDSLCNFSHQGHGALWNGLHG